MVYLALSFRYTPRKAIKMSPVRRLSIRVTPPDESIPPSRFRGRLENALLAAVDLLSRGSRDVVVRTAAQRLVSRLDAMDEHGGSDGDDRHERPLAA